MPTMVYDNNPIKPIYMKPQKYATILLFILCFHSMEAQMFQFEILPYHTDPYIDSNNVKHVVYYDNDVTQRAELFVFLPGSSALPNMYDEITKIAASLGYHALSLAYPNSPSISNLCENSPDPDCAEKARLEIIEGIDYHPDIDVDEHNCIKNRLFKLLVFLHNQVPGKGWNTFFSENNTLNWDKIVMAGHSQGGGHTALIAKHQKIRRALFFNSPSDYDPIHGFPDWMNADNETPSEQYYAFFHQQDGGDKRLLVYEMLGLLLHGKEVNSDVSQAPYQHTRVLFTDENTFDTEKYMNQNGINEHSDIIVDHELPIDNEGNIAYTPVWEYMLSHEMTTHLEYLEPPKYGLFPNPSTGKIRFYNLPENNWQWVQILDSKGKVIQKMPFQTNMNLNHLASGIYTAQLIADKSTAQIRFFIKH